MVRMSSGSSRAESAADPRGPAAGRQPDREPSGDGPQGEQDVADQALGLEPRVDELVDLVPAAGVGRGTGGRIWPGPVLAAELPHAPDAPADLPGHAGAPQPGHPPDEEAVAAPAHPPLVSRAGRIVPPTRRLRIEDPLTGEALDICPDCGGPMQERGPLPRRPPPRAPFWCDSS